MSTWGARRTLHRWVLCSAVDVIQTVRDHQNPTTTGGLHTSVSLLLLAGAYHRAQRHSRHASLAPTLPGKLLAAHHTVSATTLHLPRSPTPDHQRLDAQHSQSARLLVCEFNEKQPHGQCSVPEQGSREPGIKAGFSHSIRAKKECVAPCAPGVRAARGWAGLGCAVGRRHTANAPINHGRYTAERRTDRAGRLGTHAPLQENNVLVLVHVWRPSQTRFCQAVDTCHS